MARSKKSAGEISLAGNSRKLSRAQLAERERESRPLEKRAELLRMFDDVKARRKKALADLSKRGAVLRVMKYSAKGNPYEVEIPNPNLRIAQQCERALLDIAKFLHANSGPVESEKKPRTGLAALDAFLDEGE